MTDDVLGVVTIKGRKRNRTARLRRPNRNKLKIGYRAYADQLRASSQFTSRDERILKVIYSVGLLSREQIQMIFWKEDTASTTVSARLRKLYEHWVLNIATDVSLSMERAGMEPCHVYTLGPVGEEILAINRHETRSELGYNRRYASGRSDQNIMHDLMTAQIYTLSAVYALAHERQLWQPRQATIRDELREQFGDEALLACFMTERFFGPLGGAEVLKQIFDGQIPELGRATSYNAIRRRIRKQLTIPDPTTDQMEWLTAQIMEAQRFVAPRKLAATWWGERRASIWQHDQEIVRPDGILEFEQGGKRLLFFIELDRGNTEWSKKVRAYENARSFGGWQGQFQHNQYPAVLVVVPARRLQAVSREIMRQRSQVHYFIKEWPELMETSIADCWQSVTQPGPSISLLKDFYIPE